MARQLLEELAGGPALLYVFWPTVVAYDVVTDTGLRERIRDDVLATAAPL